MDVIELAKAFPPLNAFEQAVVSNNRPTINQLSKDSGGMASFGYSEEAVRTIRERLSENVQLPQGSAPLFVGSRLYLLQGNQNCQAEHYWLIAGRSNERALLKLLKLYRLENRSDDFSFVYSHLPDNISVPVEEQHYMLKCWNDLGDYAGTVQAAEACPELIYQSVDGESNLELIRYAASQCGNQTLLEHCQNAARHFYANLDTDPWRMPSSTITSRPSNICCLAPRRCPATLRRNWNTFATPCVTAR